MDFLFSGFIEFKKNDGTPAYIDASRIIAIEQNVYVDDSCLVVMDGAELKVPMSATELRRKVSEIRARGQKTLRALLK